MGFNSAFKGLIWVCMLGSMQRRTDKALDRVLKKDAQFTNHTKDSDWETLAQRRTITRWCELFKAFFGERAWKATRDRLWRPY